MRFFKLMSRALRAMACWKVDGQDPEDGDRNRCKKKEDDHDGPEKEVYDPQRRLTRPELVGYSPAGGHTISYWIIYPDGTKQETRATRWKGVEEYELFQRIPQALPRTDEVVWASKIQHEDLAEETDNGWVSGWVGRWVAK